MDFNKKNKLTVIIGLLSLSMISPIAHAVSEEVDMSSHSPTSVTYRIQDGYGEYTGTGETQIQAASQARNGCIWQKINAYEAAYGQTPDPDTADLFIDACINK